MGGFYGSAAVGLYASLKTAWLSYQKRQKNQAKNEQQ